MSEQLAEIRRRSQIFLTPRDNRYVTVRRDASGARRYYWQRKGYKLERLPSGRDERALRVDALNAWADGRVADEPQVEADEARAATMRAMLGSLARMMSRSKKKGWPSEVTLSDLSAVLERQGWRCAVTGLAFDAAFSPVIVDGRFSTASRPFAPSVDRINSKRGYSLDNIRVVCFAVNIALWHWGDEVFMKIARAAVERQAVLGETG